MFDANTQYTCLATLILDNPGSDAGFDFARLRAGAVAGPLALPSWVVQGWIVGAVYPDGADIIAEVSMRDGSTGDLRFSPLV